MKRIQLLIAFILCLLLQTSESVWAGNSYHVTTNGTPSSTGTIINPLDARTATLRTSWSPGDTVWIHGGVYDGNGWQFMASGTAALPVVFRNWKGERVIFSDNSGNDIIGYAKGKYCWLWGLEFVSTVAVENQAGVQMSSLSKMINCYVHDTQTTGVTTQQAEETEIYGTIFQYCGRFIPEPPASVTGGYSIYTQNVIGAGMKWVRDCILEYSYGPSLHAYTQAATISNLGFDGNVVFGSGFLWRLDRWEANFLAGSTGIPGDNLVLTNNTLFHGREYPYGKNFLTMYTNCTNATVTRNRFISTNQGIAFELDGTGRVDSNLFVGSTNISGGTGNTYLSVWPSSRPTEVIVQPNKYEAGRANVIVLNWTGATSVSINLSMVLKAGDAYRIVDAMNLYGPPVATGTYQGGSVVVSMLPGPVAIPLGSPAVQPTESIDFRVFIVIGETTPLAITLKYFEAVYVAPAVRIQWETLTESQVYRYFIIRDADTVAIVNPKGPGVYSIRDTVPGGTYRYHLAELDLDGRSMAFESVTVTVPTTSVRSDGNAPLKFGIVEVYPNPFNPSTHIIFEVAQAGNVHFSLYTLQGQMIARGDSKFYSPGRYTQEVDMTGLSSGIYFLRMIGSGVSTKKLLFIR